MSLSPMSVAARAAGWDPRVDPRRSAKPDATQLYEARRRERRALLDLAMPLLTEPVGYLIWEACGVCDFPDDTERLNRLRARCDALIAAIRSAPEVFFKAGS